MDRRTGQLVRSQIELVNGGPEERASAMGIVQRIGELKAAKRKILADFYSQQTRSIPKQSQEGEIEF